MSKPVAQNNIGSGKKQQFSLRFYKMLICHIVTVKSIKISQKMICKHTLSYIQRNSIWQTLRKLQMTKNRLQ